MPRHTNRPTDGHEHKWAPLEWDDFMGAEYEKCTLCGVTELVTDTL